MPRNTYQDFRDYDKEARNLIKDLGTGELYQLLEIVTNQLQRRCSDERIKELEAVRKVICKHPKVDQFRIDRIINGYKSEMAQTARAKDGNTIKYSKKA
jgi:Mn-containing catalase